VSAPISATALRRDLLQRRCAAQREQLAEALYAVEARLRNVDRATLVVRRLRLAPILVMAITTAIAATPMFRNLRRGLTIANVLGQLLRSRWLQSVPGRNQEPKRPPEAP
jgi:YqjK-like protein